MLSMNKFKSILKIIGIVLGAVVVLALAYVWYVVISYHRIEDHTKIAVSAPISGVENDKAEAGEEYTILSYNIGFGAYSPDYTFFMDGGKSSWAESKESVLKLVNGSGDFVLSNDPDFVLFQEVDCDSTRSYHVDQTKILAEKFPEYDSTYALNYDSPFLLYPILEPHGASKAGVLTLSRFRISSCERRSLPISESLSKYIDLDRCYSVNRLPLKNGKELVLINLHLSAYGSSEEVRAGQTAMLREEMQKEYEAGNYVIAGGDFNHDLKLETDDPALFWAHFYDRNLLPEHFSFAMDGLGSEKKQALSNTCRDAGVVYDPETAYTVTVDGFIISDNIKCTYYENLENNYEFSDHNPVLMKFVLEE